MARSWPVEEFRDYLRALMAEKRIPDYAELSRLTGVSQNQFSNWRRGLSQPSRESLSKVARVLGVKPANLWLMAGLADEDELGLEERPDLSVVPQEFIDLLELWRDEQLGEADREFIRRQVSILVAGIRGEMDAPGRGRPNGQRRVS